MKGDPDDRKSSMASNTEPEREGSTKGETAKNCCKKTMKFLFSHIGLCGMVVVYSIAGGFIFEHLEKTNDRQECIDAMLKYDPLENSTRYKLWEIAKAYAGDSDPSDPEVEDNAISEIQKILVDFRDNCLELDYNGENCTIMGEPGGPSYDWSFAGALLFSVTVITTIGYGNISPATYWGRMVCIAYATLGIPLMLLCLANIGDVMADVFKYVYSKICCCGCCRRKEPKQKDAIQGRQTPEAWKANFDKGGPVVVDDEEEEEEEEENISVPLTVTIAVIAVYLLIGAFVFNSFEEDWDLLESAYFSFVTISTIGFGDFVPSDTTNGLKMFLAAVYILLGLALLSMCFSLIQEEIAAKFTWLGEKLGFVQKDEDQEEDDDEDDDSVSRKG